MQVFNMPFITFFLAFLTWPICLGIMILYAIFFKADEEWWTLDRLFKGKTQQSQQEEKSV